MAYNPWRQGFYQGGSKKRRYFEGWYFKHMSADFSQSWSFIPGISRGDAKIALRWTRGDELLFQGAAPLAGLELVGDPASLLGKRENPSTLWSS